MAHEIARCANCAHELAFERFNARLGNQGYLYCDSDATVVTWNSYDPTYSRLSNDTHPWMLNARGRMLIERSIIACPNGGRFRFSAQPRCPFCLVELPHLNADPAYFVVLAARLAGEHEQIWRP